MYKQNTKMSNILVIEDDEEFNEALCKLLTQKGYGVLQALTGEKGIDLFKKHHVDLVITDILLPDRDGLTVILDLQKCLPEVKVIAMSGGGHLAQAEEYLDDVQLHCNIEHVLSKPFNRNELMELIHDALD